jgi:hypothetical protein
MKLPWRTLLPNLSVHRVHQLVKVHECCLDNQPYLQVVTVAMQVGGVDVTLSPSETPALTCLTALRDLHVVRVQGVDPMVLSGCASSLTRLFLWVGWDDSTLSALVRMLPHMQQLQSLELKYGEYEPFLDGVSMIPQLAADACAMLLAPAKLTTLRLEGISLAPGAAARLFAAGSTSLRDFGVSFRSSRRNFTPPLAVSDLSNLVRALPHLQQLQLDGAVAPAPAAAAAGAAIYELAPAGAVNEVPTDGEDPGSHELIAAAAAAPAVHAGWSVLRQLTALTSLCAGGRVIHDHTLQELAALTRLKQLVLLQCHGVTAVGLMQLAQLTGLTRLTVRGVNTTGWPEEISTDSELGFTDEGLQLSSQVSCVMLSCVFLHNAKCVCVLLVWLL